MKAVLVTPAWGHPWIDGLRQAFDFRRHVLTVVEPGEHIPAADIRINGWADPDTPLASADYCPNIVFMRRYELFSGGLGLDWSKVDYLICVNDWIAEVVRAYIRDAAPAAKTKVVVIYNAVDPKRWAFRQRKRGPMVGMACHVHPKKNLPLAAQVLALLPAGYELHIAGAVQDPATAEYLNWVAKGMQKRIVLYGHVPAEQMDGWWEQMNFCLSTSISEGNPNNVNEAMAKGIMPAVHLWPGASSQYPSVLTFGSAAAAAKIIAGPGPYESPAYRDWALEKFGPQNWQQIVTIAEELVSQRRAA